MNTYYFNAVLVNKEDRRKRRQESLPVKNYSLKEAWDEAEQLANELFPDEEATLSVGAA